MVTQTHFKLSVGDELQIDYAPQPVQTRRKSAKSSRLRFEVVHDDEHIILVNKPAGLLTVPTPRREQNTLRCQVRKHLERMQQTAKAICVHRLDRGVSGLLVFAKNEEVADQIRSQFEARKPQRKYAAIVAGKVENATGTFRSFMKTNRETLDRYSVDEHEEGGELAITHYRVKEYWRGATLVEVQLETGRRNQIRVHFAEVGHPVIGEPRYEVQKAQHTLWPHKRIALHAETLGLTHPATGETLLFKAPWPQEFRDFRRKANR